MEITPLIGSVATGYGADSPREPEMSYGENSQGLKDASRDFVSILFSYMFTSMRGNPDDEPDDEENGGGGKLFGGANVSMFMGFLDQEIGKKFADQGGKDMVDALYYQLKGKNEFPADDKNSSKMKNPVSDHIIKVGEKDKVNKADENVIEKNKVI